MKGRGWLVFFYGVPSSPVRARMKIWRRLTKSGALPFKDAVYILPYNEEHYEFFQWLASEVISLRGECGFVKAEQIENIKDHEIIAFFNKQRAKEYKDTEKALNEIERKLSNIRKGGRTQDNAVIQQNLTKIIKEYEEIRRIDFFASDAGNIAKKKIKSVESEIKGLGLFGKNKDEKSTVRAVSYERIKDYQQKVWVTRKMPFIDRMASAWLIKRFIDNKAVFKFMDEKDMEKTGKNIVTFDVRDGKFTHVGDMCTFEVLLRAFGIKDNTLKKIAGIVHELDMKDEKFRNPESKGIEDILTGVRKTANDDAEALEKGMALFEMLYASRK